MNVASYYIFFRKELFFKFELFKFIKSVILLMLERKIVVVFYFLAEIKLLNLIN